jgi:hypothetical protein
LNDTRVGRNHSVAQHMAYDSAHTFTPSFNYGHIPKYDPSSPSPLQPGPFSAKPTPTLSGIRTGFGPSPKLPTEHKFFGEAQSSFPSYSHAPALPLQSKFVSRPETAPEMVTPPSSHPPLFGVDRLTPPPLPPSSLFLPHIQEKSSYFPPRDLKS